MDVDVNTYLPGDLLVKVDITTMANSLEARSPFLDHQLMEWAAGLPAALKIRRAPRSTFEEGGGGVAAAPSCCTGRNRGSACRWPTGCAPSCGTWPGTC